MRKVGINCDFMGDDGFEACITQIKNSGFDSVFIGDYGYRNFGRAIDFARAVGLEVETVHSPFDGINDMWLKESDPRGGKMLERLKESVDKCARFFIPVCVVHLSSGWNPPIVSDAGLKRYDELIEYARARGIALAFENLRKLANLAVLFEKYEKDGTVKFCYDCGHEACYTEKADMLSLFGEKLVCVHLHDNFGRPEDRAADGDFHLIPFDGNIDFGRVTAGLKKCGFDGTMMLETGINEKFYGRISLKKFTDKAYAAADRLRKATDRE